MQLDRMSSEARRDPSARKRNDSNIRRLAFATALVQADVNARRSTCSTAPVLPSAAPSAVGPTGSAVAASAAQPKTSAFTSVLVRIRPKSAAKRSYLIGTLTGLLPCGWLWAFVIAAAGTGSVVAGSAVMFAFWLGTVPAMVGLLRVTGPVLSRIRARMPAVTAVALIIVGLGTLALRWRDAGETQVAKPHCHCHGETS